MDVHIENSIYPIQEGMSEKDAARHAWRLHRKSSEYIKAETPPLVHIHRRGQRVKTLRGGSGSWNFTDSEKCEELDADVRKIKITDVEMTVVRTSGLRTTYYERLVIPTTWWWILDPSEFKILIEFDTNDIPENTLKRKESESEQGLRQDIDNDKTANTTYTKLIHNITLPPSPKKPKPPTGTLPSSPKKPNPPTTKWYPVQLEDIQFQEDIFLEKGQHTYTKDDGKKDTIYTLDGFIPPDNDVGYIKINTKDTLYKVDKLATIHRFLTSLIHGNLNDGLLLYSNDVPTSPVTCTIKATYTATAKDKYGEEPGNALFALDHISTCRKELQERAQNKLGSNLKLDGYHNPIIQCTEDLATRTKFLTRDNKYKPQPAPKQVTEDLTFTLQFELVRNMDKSTLETELQTIVNDPIPLKTSQYFDMAKTKITFNSGLGLGLGKTVKVEDMQEQKLYYFFPGNNIRGATCTIVPEFRIEERALMYVQDNFSLEMVNVTKQRQMDHEERLRQTKEHNRQIKEEERKQAEQARRRLHSEFMTSYVKQKKQKKR